MAVSSKKVSKTKHKAKTSTAHHAKVVKKRIGGTLIQSPAVFSVDSQYLFINCGWGVKAFSIKTGECFKVLETSLNGYGRVLSIFIVNDCPVVTTLNKSNEVLLLYWDYKTSKITKKSTLELPKQYKEYVGMYSLLVPSVSHKATQDLCLVIGKSNNIYAVLFYNPESLQILQHPLNGTHVGFSVGKQYLSFGGSPDMRVMATVVKGIGLCVYSLDGTMEKIGLQAGQDVDWSSVCCHPTDCSLAAGDLIGRCILFRNPLKQPKVKTVFHWHTLPCDVIAFTPAGSSMYTGGGEHVLVKWNLENPNVRSYLPRLSAPLVHISVASDNSLAAVSTLDNGVILVESSHKVNKVLQQLAWGVMSHESAQLFPAGLTFDPVSRSIVLNSRPGHLQFFCPETENSISVDICQQNYLTQERNKVIVNADVTSVALSSDSAWMATVETRDEQNLSLQLKLKFWEYQLSSKRWLLNSVVDMPHSGRISCLRFQPVPRSDSTSPKYLVVTTGEDAKFRLWSPSPIDSIYKKGVVWKCEGAAGYKDHQVGAACFSQDASLLAVAFEHILTLWSTEQIKFKTSLSRFSSSIKQVEFGRDVCSHLLVTTTNTDVTVWNLLTLCVDWTASVEPSLLIADPSSIFMAVISNKKKRLFVFSPLDSDILHKEKDLCSGNAKIVGGTFATRECENWKAPQWLFKSIFYYLDSNQELKSIECVNDVDSTGSGVDLAGDEEKPTLFGELRRVKSASNAVNEKQEDHPRKHQYGVVGSTAVTQLLRQACHTMAPMSALCPSLLEAFALSKMPLKEKERQSRMEVDDDYSDEGLGYESDSSGRSSQPSSSDKKKSTDFSFSSPSFETPTLNTKPKDDDLFFIDLDEQVDDIINS